MEQSVLSVLENGVYYLTLNRPKVMNCINMDVLECLKKELKAAKMNDSVRVVVIRGAGDRAFCSGGDLKEFSTLSKQGLVHWIRSGNELFNRLESLAKPTIAVIQGFAYGGGLELALACDLRLATDRASFCMPELRHGWVPGWGGVSRLRRLIGEARAKELIILGEPIDSQRAMQMGLVTRVIPTDEIERELKKWLDIAIQLEPSVFGLAKSALHDPQRLTAGADMQYDILATLYSRIIAD
jgi:enoyl-CoA hydratase/carnithine racemase